MNSIFIDTERKNLRIHLKEEVNNYEINLVVYTNHQLINEVLSLIIANKDANMKVCNKGNSLIFENVNIELITNLVKNILVKKFDEIKGLKMSPDIFKSYMLFIKSANVFGKDLISELVELRVKYLINYLINNIDCSK